METACRAMKWSSLLAQSGLVPHWSGPVDPEIAAVVEDSRQVRAGTCFVAVRGTRFDGHAFIEAAVREGALAVVCEQPVSVPAHVAVLQLPSTRGATGRLLARLYDLDVVTREGLLKVIGVTGTNGKSTICFLLREILRRADYPTALLGTVEYDLLSRTIVAGHTTPPAAELMGYLAEAVSAGATHAVMEASSHALDQGRCDGVRFAVGVFTNLTGDHQDYHKTMDAYLQAKKRLFDNLAPDAVAAVNVEDSAAERMVSDCRAPVVRYGVWDEQTAAFLPQDRLDVWAKIHRITPAGTVFDLLMRVVPAGGAGRVLSCRVNSVLVGRHNVQNCLAAASAATAVGVPLARIAAGLNGIREVVGRLQPVSVPGADVTVLVDYAHTDDALLNVLSALRPLASRRLIVVFGCGGDRDRGKRPRMARVVARHADVIVVTSDNPRTEDPLAIIDEILLGFSRDDRAKVTVEPDRRLAIGQAIAMAEEGDVVLLAGKGHEAYQEIGRERFPFDDAALARDFLRSRVHA